MLYGPLHNLLISSFISHLRGICITSIYSDELSHQVYMNFMPKIKQLQQRKQSVEKKQKHCQIILNCNKRAYLKHTFLIVKHVTNMLKQFLDF